MSEELFEIPVMPPRMEPVARDYPISPRENLLRAMHHEKPLWMPALYEATQWVFPSVFNDIPQDMTKDGEDWFGVHYKYEPAQRGHTPQPGLLEDITVWRETIHWPNLASMDWAAEADSFLRDENKALAARLGNGNFERLHEFEGFEQALCDLLIEPEECKAFFDRMGEYKINLFNCINEVYPLDYVCHNDDWANAKSQFFSNEVFETELLDSSVAMADAFRAAGCSYMLHCCGKMEAFLPYIVNDIHADVLEIQSINDIRGILDQYGDKVSPMFYPDPYILYNPKTIPEQAREYARSIVDNYGAHTCKGAGAFIRLIGNNPDVYYAFEDEIYEYSRKKYAEL